MILRRTVFTLATSPRVVMPRASDEDARRISTYRAISEFSTLQGCKSDGKP
jgi:hypothetical protein